MAMAEKKRRNALGIKIYCENDYLIFLRICPSMEIFCHLFILIRVGILPQIVMWLLGRNYDSNDWSQIVIWYWMGFP